MAANGLTEQEQAQLIEQEGVGSVGDFRSLTAENLLNCRPQIDIELRREEKRLRDVDTAKYYQVQELLDTIRLSKLAREALYCVADLVELRRLDEPALADLELGAMDRKSVLDGLRSWAAVVAVEFDGHRIGLKQAMKGVKVVNKQNDKYLKAQAKADQKMQKKRQKEVRATHCTTLIRSVRRKHEIISMYMGSHVGTDDARPLS